MAHFAKVDDNNKVVEVIVVDNKNAETEQAGKDYIASLGLEGNWIQTSYNRNFRNNFAGPGDVYDPVNDKFVYDEFAPYEPISYAHPWQGVFKPNKQSILFDAAPRCANIWTISFINQAFPDIFQRWGYLNPHSPESFTEISHIFGVVATTIRNPIDSLASQIVMFKTDVTNNREVNNLIQKHIDILQSTLDNKNNVTIFSFEAVTENPENVVSTLSNMLGVEAQSFDKDAVFNNLKEFAEITDMYNVPINNQDKLDEAKTILNQERFADLMAKADELYNKLLVFVEA